MKQAKSDSSKNEKKKTDKRSRSSRQEKRPYNSVFGFEVLKRIPRYIEESNKAYSEIKNISLTSDNKSLSDFLGVLENGPENPPDNLDDDYLLQNYESYFGSVHHMEQTVLKRGKNEFFDRRQVWAELEKKTVHDEWHFTRDREERSEPGRYLNSNTELDAKIARTVGGELDSWNRDWGHIISFPLPSTIEHPDISILNHFWRLNPAELLFESSASSTGPASTKRWNQTLEAALQNSSVPKEMQDIYDAHELVQSFFLQNVHRRTAKSLIRFTLEINPLFANKDILDSSKDRIEGILDILRSKEYYNEYFSPPKARPDNIYEYFETYDLFTSMKESDPGQRAADVARTLWPKEYREEITRVKKEKKKKAEMKKTKTKKKDDQPGSIANSITTRVKTHVDAVSPWIQNLSKLLPEPSSRAEEPVNIFDEFLASTSDEIISLRANKALERQESDEQIYAWLLTRLPEDSEIRKGLIKLRSNKNPPG